MTNYGFSESPLIDGDLLICTPGGPGGTLAALNKKTGALVWRSKDWTDKAPYSSVVAADIQGVRQYLQIGYDGAKAIGHVAGVDAKAGKVLWKAQIFSGVNDGVSTSPVVKGNEVYVSAPWGGGCHLFEINKAVAKELYSKKAQKRMRNTFGGVVVVNDDIYGHTEPGAWLCQDWKTGDEKWLERGDLKCQSGAIIAAEGMLYLYTDEGEAALVAADPTNFKMISSFTIPKKSEIPPNRVTSRQSRVWTHPVIANGVLYLRDHEYIFAFDVSNGKKKAERQVPGGEYRVLTTEYSVLRTAPAAECEPRFLRRVFTRR
jgi:outer membrane protein assembly factor BamB